MKTAWWATMVLSAAACVPNPPLESPTTAGGSGGHRASSSTGAGAGGAGTGGTVSTGGTLSSSTSTSSGGGGATASTSSASSTSSTATSSSSTATSSTATSSSTAASSSGGTGGKDAGPTAAGTIVPLYTDPPDSSWTAIAAAAAMHPTVAVWAVINPETGPGSSSDPAYATAIPQLVAAGITVLGYVATNYAGTSSLQVQGEIDAYRSWYPSIRGIFFDQMSSVAGSGHEGYYAGLTSYAKGKGFQVTVGNPGTDTVASFVGTVDTILIYEGNGVPSVSSLGGWHAQYDKSNFGVIPYGVPSLNTSFVTGARADVGFIYLTSDALPNPWDSLTPYFSGLLGALE